MALQLPLYRQQTRLDSKVHMPVFGARYMEEHMDRLQFILGSLQSPEGFDGMLEGMLAIAIRSEIENIVHRSASAFPCIDTYMIQTRAMSA